MGSINELLTKRLKKGDHPSSKMTEMARQSANGNLNGFSGIFSVSELSPHEKSLLKEILQTHGNQKNDIPSDLNSLISLTAEVKAINNQAAILHGERIKKAQNLLKNYQEGAFTAWLIAAYGNRQTPYNLMQYYEFYEALPKTLRPQIESMPRQAIYTLASRDAPFDKKQLIIENYKGETKAELLMMIRDLFPLSAQDKRGKERGKGVLQGLKQIYNRLKNKKLPFNQLQKNELIDLLDKIKRCL